MIEIPTFGANGLLSSHIQIGLVSMGYLQYLHFML